MLSTKSLAVMAVSACAALGGVLGGCSSSSTLSRYTHESPEAAQQAAGTYLDGTGPTAEASERAETRRQTDRQARRIAPAEPQAARAEDLSARTTGARAPTQSEPLKPYTDAWWEKENRDDARLKQKMNICRGC